MLKYIALLLLPMTTLAGETIVMPRPTLAQVFASTTEGYCGNGSVFSYPTGFTNGGSAPAAQVAGFQTCGGKSGRGPGTPVKHYTTCAIVSWDLFGNMSAVVPVACGTLDPNATFFANGYEQWGDGFFVYLTMP